MLEDRSEGVRRALRRRETEGPTQRLLRAADHIRIHRHFPAPYRREPFDQASAIDALMLEVELLSELTARTSNPRDSLYVDTTPVRVLVARTHEAEKVRARDYDGLEAELVRLAQNREFGRRRGSASIRQGSPAERGHRGARYGRERAP